VARRDLVAESLADLGDAEGNFLAAGLQDVAVLHEDRLGRLRAQVDRRRGLVHRTDLRAKHQAELARWRPVMVAAIRTADAPLLTDPRHLFDRQPLGLLAGRLLDQRASAEAAAADAALHLRVIELRDVPAHLPDARVEQNSAVHPDDVLALVDEASPPEIFDVAAHLDSQRAVVPGIGETSIGLAALEHEPATLRERNDRLHRHPAGFRLGHGALPSQFSITRSWNRVGVLGAALRRLGTDWGCLGVAQHRVGRSAILA